MSALKGLLITADRFPPERSDVKVLWAQEMVSRGYQLDWIMQSRQVLAKPALKSYGSGHVLLAPMNAGNRLWHRLHKHWQAIRNECRVFGQLRKTRYDFVLVRDKSIAALLARCAAWRTKTPCLFWLSFPFPENSLYRARQGVARYPLLYRLRGHVQFCLLYRVLLPRMDHVFVTSEQMKRDLIAYGIPASRISAFSMGIDAARMQASQAAEVVAGRYTLVYLGAMDRAREMDFLLRVLQRIHKTEPKARLLMVGCSENEADMQWLHAEAIRLGVANAVEFTGQLPQQEAWLRVREARVAFSPFKPSKVLDSASPTKLVEYLYLGVPTVANEHPEQSRVIDESGCGKAVPWEEPAFVEAALQLLSLDDADWHALSARGQQWAMQHRSYDAIATRLHAVLEQVIKE